jgi:hypothetical protein
MADLVGSELLVGDERGFNGASAVGFGGPGVGACGVGCGVPHEVDDDDNVDAVAQEVGAERAAQGVGVDPRFAHVGVTGLVDEAGRNAELGDDVADRADPYWLMRSYGPLRGGR